MTSILPYSNVCVPFLHLYTINLTNIVLRTPHSQCVLSLASLINYLVFVFILILSKVPLLLVIYLVQTFLFFLYILSVGGLGGIGMGLGPGGHPINANRPSGGGGMGSMGPGGQSSLRCCTYILACT